jgi:integrase/recombinase XerD
MTHDNSMVEKVREYLRVRRATGMRLRIEGQQLLSFAHFADRQRHRSPLTVALAVRWACASPRAGPVGRARRLEVIRPFARYLCAFDERTEVPAPGLLGPAHRRRAPYVYTDHEISQLLTWAARLPPAKGLRSVTLRMLLGLLACTGLRPCEAIALRNADIDLQGGILTIRQTKFRKSRLVPIHASAARALRQYVRVRDQSVSTVNDDAFFVLAAGVPLTLVQAERAFVWIRHHLNWSVPAGHRAPRLYDLRHAFACRRLQRWYADTVDVDNAITALATYLGHVKVSDTYWYLSATPELMALAAKRFEIFTRERNRRML